LRLNAWNPRVVSLTLVATYALVAFVLLVPDAIYSIDAAVKLVQARAFLASHFSSLALPYPGRYLDGTYAFFPFDPPFVFRSAGAWQAIFPTAVALLNVPFAWAGTAGLTVPSLAGAGLTCLAMAHLSRSRAEACAAIAVLGLCTCFWFYAVIPWEHLPALAASTAAFAVARRRRDAGAQMAGLLLGIAAIWRDESWMLLPGLLAALLLWPTPDTPRLTARAAWRGAVVLCVAAAIPTIVIGLLDVLAFNRPAAAHLRHASTMIESWLHLPVPAGLPQLDPIAPRDRVWLITDYWLLGWPIRSAFGVITIAWLLLVWTLRRHRAGVMLTAAGVATLAVVHGADLVRLLAAPRFVNGLLRLSPFLIFAALPAASTDGDRHSNRRVTGITALGYAICLLLALNTASGKSLGPRLLLPLLPLLVVTAVETLVSYRERGRTSRIAAIAWGFGLMLIAGSAVMQIGVAVRAYTAYVRAKAPAIAYLAASRERVLIIDNPFTISAVAPFYDTRTVLLGSPQTAPLLAERLRTAGERSFLVVSRDANSGLTFPGWTPATPAVAGGAMVVQRWVR
jgi:hypothetical protein